MTAQGRRQLLVLLVSVLLCWPPPAHGTAEGDRCDVEALEGELAAAQHQVAAVQAANQALSLANQALTLETERLRAESKAARATIDSFVSRLFGQPVDGNVAAAARTAALAELTAARTRAPRDHRLRAVQRSFEHGEQAMRRREPGRAVHEFRETYEMAARIQPPLPSTPQAGSAD